MVFLEKPILCEIKPEVFLYCVYSQNIIYHAAVYMCHNYKRMANTVHITQKY